MTYAKNWMARRRNAQRSVYLHSSIEAVAAGFRQTVDASRALVDDLTPLRLLQAHEASGVLSELTNRPETPWDGATGSGMNWRLAVSELEAERRNLRLDGEPVVLYSLLSPPGSARSNLLVDLYRLDATPDGHARMASSAARFCPPQDPGSAAPLLLKALLDERPCTGDGGERGGDGGHGGGGGVRPLRGCPGRA